METVLNHKANASGLAKEDRTREALEFVHHLLQATSEDLRTLHEMLVGLARAFDASNAGLFALNHSGEFSKECFAGPPLKAVFPWKTRPEFVEKLLTAPAALVLAEGDIRWLVASVCSRPQDRWLVWVASDLRDWSVGESATLPLAGQALLRWTELQQSRPGLTRNQSELEQSVGLTRRLAHDFSNVLTSILGFTELSLAQVAGESPPKRYLQEVWQAAQEGAGWLRKLQQFSRRTPPKFLPSDLVGIVQGETGRLRSAWGNEVTLLVALADALPQLALDADSLRQLLAILLENAREAIVGPGVVAISARATDLTDTEGGDLVGRVRAGRYVEITITDTGRGMTSETRQRLFREVFFSTKPCHRGLSLAVVYGLLHAFGGGLRFGPDPAQGTAVHLFLPAATEQQPSGRPVVNATTAFSARILVVDDDHLILESVCQLLEQAGHKVKAVPGPVEAMACYTTAREPFHLVLSDVMMPGMNGFDMVHRLRQKDPALNALFISSLDAVLPKDDLLRQFGVLRKPFEPAMLVEAVNNALKRDRQSPL